MMKQLIAFVVMIATLSSIVVQQGGKNTRSPNKRMTRKASVVQIAQEEPVSWGFVLLTDSSGTNTIKAKPLSRTDGNVTLKMRNGHVLTVALSKFSKADRDLLSETFTKKPEDVATGTEFLGKDLVRAYERFPQETQVRRETLVKERREEFYKKYDNSTFDLRFTIEDIAPNRSQDGPYYVRVSDIPAEGGRICFDGGTAGLGLHLDADEAKSVSKGDRLHIRGKVSFSVDNGRLGRFAYRFDGSQGVPTFSWFWFEDPTITIEQTESSSRLKDAVATKVAELRKLEAGEPKGKKSEPLGEERFPIPDKEAKVVGESPSPPLPTKLEDPFRQPESYRVWADTKGHRVEAAFVEHNGLNVTLRKHDGKEITLPISTFSRDDLEWMLKGKWDMQTRVRALEDQLAATQAELAILKGQHKIPEPPKPIAERPKPDVTVAENSSLSYQEWISAKNKISPKKTN